MTNKPRWNTKKFAYLMEQPPVYIIHTVHAGPVNCIVNDLDAAQASAQDHMDAGFTVTHVTVWHPFNNCYDVDAKEFVRARRKKRADAGIKRPKTRPKTRPKNRRRRRK